VDEMLVEEAEPLGQTEFTISESSSDGASLLPIPPDLATCVECAAELRAVEGRRRGYAFNTCTACGPRFTIACAVPFDRPTNAMREFPLCPECSREYGDPGDRRFHAQTISCPACGPSLSFTCLSQPPPALQERSGPLDQARQMLKDGRILAVKGIGGFHLACDATREDVVQELRRRKRRPHKPLAIMVRDIAACRRICEVSLSEEELLTSAQSPIVLLLRKAGGTVADGVAPGLAHLGVMLPYTPLHIMVLDDGEAPAALVMTSCNRAEEPIALEASVVLTGLRDIVDGVLTHDREIVNRCDDSLVAVFRDAPLPMRRSRGYVPEPVLLDRAGPPTLGTGAMWKNAFALTSGRRAFLSQHVGDVSDADNAAYFAETLRKFSELLRLEPEVVACDMHPDYPTSAFAGKLARERGLELIQVQHHHAHVASCLAEHHRSGPMIGVSMDGTGYGEDGAVWGGEFLVADLKHYERRYHFQYVPMPGGEQAILQPDRMALAHLAQAMGRDAALERMAPSLGETSATALLDVMGRAVAALLGVRHRVTYEGQAACELEAISAGGVPGTYGFDYDEGGILLGAIVRCVCSDLDGGVPAPTIAARFHNTVAAIIVETCRRLRAETSIREVAMSGGVMQNRLLLSLAVPALEKEGFDVLLQTAVPPNDGGICLGQAACAIARMADTC
jgi:hydrogenase maturation protein HypF